MTKKGKDTEIISVSLPTSTAMEMDGLVGEMGYPSRSELVRDAVRALIKSKLDMESLEGTIEGVMIILYDHKAAQDAIADLPMPCPDRTATRSYAAKSSSTLS